MGSKPVKISEDLYRRAEELAQRTGKSLKEVVEDALAKYFGLVEGLGSDSDIKNVKVVKSWRLRYNATCAYCKRELRASEEVVREIVELEDGRKINNFYHPECYVYSTDSTMARLYVKKRQMEKLIKALKKQADELADVIEEAETRKRLMDIAEDLQRIAGEKDRVLAEARKLVEDYIVKPEERAKILESLSKLEEKLEQLREVLEERGRQLEEIAAAMSIRIKPPRRGKRLWGEEEWGA